MGAVVIYKPFLVSKIKSLCKKALVVIYSSMHAAKCYYCRERKVRTKYFFSFYLHITTPFSITPARCSQQAGNITDKQFVITILLIEFCFI